jgi:preprotein translocase subunit SecD
MRWISLLLGLMCLLYLPARAGHSPPPLLFRVYVQTSGEGLPNTQAQTIQIPPSGETIMIRTMPEVTEADLIGVQVDAAGNVHCQFNHVGQINLDAVTAQNQGRVLVVMVNGYVVFAPTIDEEISTGELIIPPRLKTDVIQLMEKMAQRNLTSSKKA